jgi:hypothetical protein
MKLFALTSPQTPFLLLPDSLPQVRPNLAILHVRSNAAWICCPEEKLPALLLIT